MALKIAFGLLVAGVVASVWICLRLLGRYAPEVGLLSLLGGMASWSMLSLLGSVGAGLAGVVAGLSGRRSHAAWFAAAAACVSILLAGFGEFVTQETVRATNTTNFGVTALVRGETLLVLAIGLLAAAVALGCGLFASRR